jgi:hypothetical protein
VAREDIHFRNVAEGRVRITVTVHNRGGAWSQATTMRVEAAPLGAFIPMRPLTTLQVPAIPPLRCVNVSTEVDETPVRPPDDTQPAPRAVPAASDTDMDADESRAARREFLLGRRALRHVAENNTGNARLPENITKMGGWGGLHWAGNLGVFIDDCDVARHKATQLRIVPTAHNRVWFLVGNHQRDRYRISVCREPGWEYELMGFAEDEWMAVDQAFGMLSVTPPVDARHGSFSIYVEQASTGKTSIVEYGFDADAAGPGCPTD